MFFNMEDAHDRNVLFPGSINKPLEVGDEGRHFAIDPIGPMAKRLLYVDNNQCG